MLYYGFHKQRPFTVNFCGLATAARIETRATGCSRSFPLIGHSG